MKSQKSLRKERNNENMFTESYMSRYAVAKISHYFVNSKLLKSLRSNANCRSRLIYHFTFEKILSSICMCAWYFQSQTKLRTLTSSTNFSQRKFSEETHLVLKVGFVVELLEVAFLGYWLALVRGSRGDGLPVPGRTGVMAKTQTE